MQPKIVVGRPPNYEDIIKVFPRAANATTIFAYDDTIYVSRPEARLSKPIIEHEVTHLIRQRQIGVKLWWKCYLTDKNFRYHEETLAHQTEYREMIRTIKDREGRHRALGVVARRLIAPLYQFEGVSLNQAMNDVRGELRDTFYQI